MDRPRAYALRAVGVAVVWVLGCLSAFVGRAGCPFAALFGIPCPGCGMTRAVLLMSAGHFAASLRMNALAVPSALATLAVMGATVWVTGKTGSPEGMWRDRTGRLSLLFFVGVQALVLALWGARMLGAFGGPPPLV
jgi:hypothetical protein